MSNKDNIYFSREEYNKLMQIIIDNKNCKDEEIKCRAEQLNEKFEKYVYLYEKQTEGKLEEGVIFRAYSNELKWIGVRIDIWTHLMRGCIINYVH